MKRVLLILALLIPAFMEAQETHHEIGMGLGLANYYGDLQPKFFASNGYRPMATIVYKFFPTPRVGLRTGVSFAQLTAADSLSRIQINQRRNLSFATNLFEFHGALEFNFLPIDILHRKVSPYIFGGIGVFYFNPYAEDTGGNKHFLRPLSTEGQGLPMYPDRKQYSLVNLSFPFGGGFKFFIGKTLMVTPEIGFRYTNTDYLDDVSKSYVNMDTLEAYKGKLARSMSFRGSAKTGEAYNDPNYNPNYGYQRGDPKANDWFWWANITVTVYFRSFGNQRPYTKTKCPNFFYGGK